MIKDAYFFSLELPHQFTFIRDFNQLKLLQVEKTAGVIRCLQFFVFLSLTAYVQ